MDLTVGDHDGSGDTRGRHVAEGAFERAEEPRLGAFVGGVGAAGLDHAHLELREAGEPLLQAFQRSTRLGLAVAYVLALAAVDDESNDALQRLALLVEKHRVDEGGGKGGERGETEPRAALAEEQPGQREQRDRDQDDCQPGPREQRFEGERPVHEVGLSPSRIGP